MPYSPRQQACLQAMGLVPWVLRTSVPAPLLPSRNPAAALQAVPVESSAEQALRPATAPGTTGTPGTPGTPSVATSPMMEAVRRVSAAPESIEDLSDWLPKQYLSVIGHQGNDHFTLGHDDAPLLVVVEQVELVGGQLPLTGDAAQLFAQMLRAIDLNRGDMCQCAITPGSVVAAAAPQLPSACQPGRRAALWLTHALSASDDPDEHRCQGSMPIPIWRLPHPDLLLQQPQRKRQAWAILKAVRAVLQRSGT